MQVCVYIYVYSNYDSYNRQAGEWQNTDACSRTQKSEMETLPEALGCSVEQSQPPENLHRTTMEKIEEKSSVPVRQHFVLSKTRYIFHTSPSLLQPKEGGRYHLLHHVYSLSFRTEIHLDFLPNECVLPRILPQTTCTYLLTTQQNLCPRVRAGLHTLYSVSAQGWFSSRQRNKLWSCP